MSPLAFRELLRFWLEHRLQLAEGGGIHGHLEAGGGEGFGAGRGDLFMLGGGEEFVGFGVVGGTIHDALKFLLGFIE